MKDSERELIVEDLKIAMESGDSRALEKLLDDTKGSVSDKRALTAEAYVGATSKNVQSTDVAIRSLVSATSSNVTSTAQAIEQFLASLKK